MSHKRVISTNSAEASDFGRAKAARTMASDPTVQQLQAEVAQLKTYIEEVHSFIDSENLVAKAPQSIQSRMSARASGASKLADSIRKSMIDTSGRMREDIAKAGHSGVTFDDLSTALLPLIPQIEKLSKLPQPEALRLAQDLAVELAEHTVPGDSQSSGHGNRPSDAMCDGLLYNIIEERAERFDMESDVLKDTVKRIESAKNSAAAFGINPWLPRSLDLLQEYQYSS